jgi:mannose-6-phosphate isomerase
MDIATLISRPLRLVQNKIVRYPGGREIDRFRGVTPPQDDGRPEAWVGSTTSVWYQREEDRDRGQAEVYLGDSQDKMLLRELLKTDPAGFMGAKHVAENGPNTALLVKLLDAERQLGLQSHPDRAFAKQQFNSDYGKVECWYIIGLREDVQEPPYVLMGFKEGVTRERFQELFLKDDIRSMEQCCHKVPVQVGEMFFVDAGVPHAVGPGCFLIEAQEPSDITVGARWRQFDDPAEQARFIERTMGCYHYDGRSYQENLDALRIPPTTVRENAQGREQVLLGQAQTPFFGVSRYEVTGAFAMRDTGAFSIAIVLEGQGQLRYRGGSMSIGKADELFLSAGAQDMIWCAEGEPLQVVCCHPPRVL